MVACSNLTGSTQESDGKYTCTRDGWALQETALTPFGQYLLISCMCAICNTYMCISVYALAISIHTHMQQLIGICTHKTPYVIRKENIFYSRI